MTTAATDDVVSFDKKDTKCVITLNRPKALNALNQSMIRLITPKLRVSKKRGQGTPTTMRFFPLSSLAIVSIAEGTS